MRFKATPVLLLVFAALGLFVYFTEYRGREEREKEEQAKTKAVQVEPGDISEITLTHQGQTFTGVRKADKLWEITSPPGIEADSETWEQLASDMTGIERQETVAEGTTDPEVLNNYGLATPTNAVTAKTRDGKTIELQFGAENPGKTGNYA